MNTNLEQTHLNTLSLSLSLSLSLPMLEQETILEFLLLISIYSHSPPLSLCLFSIFLNREKMRRGRKIWKDKMEEEEEEGVVDYRL